MSMFSTEMVSKYHPDKYADQISDSILTAVLRKDPHAHVACEVMAKDTTVVLGGEITASCDIDYEAVVRSVGDRLGYKVDKVINLITKQSAEIGGAVDSDEMIGAGDQGMMFGFAVKGGKYFLPFGQEVAIDIIRAIEKDIEENPDSPFLGDAKTQVTTDLAAPGFLKPVDTILISVCHKEGLTINEVKAVGVASFNVKNCERSRHVLEVHILEAHVDIPVCCRCMDKGRRADHRCSHE